MIEPQNRTVVRVSDSRTGPSLRRRRFAFSRASANRRFVSHWCARSVVVPLTGIVFRRPVPGRLSPNLFEDLIMVAARR